MKTEEGHTSRIHKTEVESQPSQSHEIEVEKQPLQTHEAKEDEGKSFKSHETEASPSEVATDAALLGLMEEKLKKLPKLLIIKAASSSCSIFRVPQSIKEVHSKSFQPSVFSIGPYHHGEKHLQMIEEHKWRILRANLNRLQNCKRPVTLNNLFRVIASKEKEIRECYSENIDKYTSHQLIEMMLLDGGFIIELLCVVNGLIIPEPDDPIFYFPWMFFSLTRDLLMLENQIPFLVLEIVYAKSISDHLSVPSLQELILKLFDYSVPRYVDVKILCDKYKDYKGKHILDFYRSTFLPSTETEKEKAPRCCGFGPRRPSYRKETTTIKRDTIQPLPEKDPVGDGKSSFHFIQPVEKLLEVGIKFKKREEEGLHSFLDIKFKDGILQIPLLTTSEIMSPLILNCMAFEQCSKDSSKHFTSYFNFMGCLINTTDDAQYLRKKNIIENLFGTDQELVAFFNEVGKNIPYYYEEDYLMEICEEMEIYYRRRVWHVRFAKFLSLFLMKQMGITPQNSRKIKTD